MKLVGLKPGLKVEHRVQGQKPAPRRPPRKTEAQTPEAPRGVFMSEEGVLRALERHFPSSEWVGELPPGATLPSRPLSASTQSDAAETSSDAIPVLPLETGGTGAYVFLGGAKGDLASHDEAIARVEKDLTRPSLKPEQRESKTKLLAKYQKERPEIEIMDTAIRDWVSSLPDESRVVTTGARGAEAYVVRLAEARGLHVYIPEASKEMYGPKASEVQVSEVLSSTDDRVWPEVPPTPIVLIGTGTRVSAAQDYCKPWYREHRKILHLPQTS